MRARYILFDLFDTLVEKDEVEFGRIFECIRDRLFPGCPRSELSAYADEYRRDYLDKRKESGVEYSFKHQLEFYCRAMGTGPRVPLGEVEWECFMIGRTGRLVDGVPEALSELKEKGFRMGVVSNTIYSSATVRRYLGALGISDYFDAVITSADEGVRKPRRAIFEDACRALGTAADRSVLFVGNSLGNDAEGAYEAGLTPVLFSRRGDSWNGLTVGSMEELVPLAERTVPIIGKKKVLFIGGNLRINGISTILMGLVRRLGDRYQFIVVNTAPGEGACRREVLERGGKVYDVICPGEGRERTELQARRIREIIAEERPDAVHSNYWSSNGLFIEQAYLEGVPERIAQCNNAPTDLPEDKILARDDSSSRAGRYATCLLACSEAARRFAYGDRGETVYSPVDFERFAKAAHRHEDGPAEEKKRILFAGRFTKQKNIQFLLDLAERLLPHREIEIVLTGSGPMEGMIAERIANLRLENVRVLGAEQDFADLLAVSDLFVMPSLYEGLCLSLIEAQASGVKCLASDAITEESQIGLAEYLPLDLGTWERRALEILSEPYPHEPRYDRRFDAKFVSARYDGIYSGADSDEWVKRGKEYSLGSRRFLRDKDLSQYCYETAMGMGNVRGRFYYALGCFEGNGSPKDPEKARRLVEPIVPSIEAEADEKAEYTVILGDLYSFGLGKEQDYARAASLYRKAADMGNLEAMCDLGYIYLVGQGVEKDERLSCRWFKKSADLGYVHSMRDIGQNYYWGKGCEVDYPAAIRYFRMAMDNNYAHGTGDLAGCYFEGKGVEKDWKKAAELYLEAYRQDSERAFRDIHDKGIDVRHLLERGEIRISESDEISGIDAGDTFNGCLYISGRIERVDPGCFYSSDVRKIFADGGNPRFKAKGGVLFSSDMKTLVRFPPKSAQREYTVPNGVEVIGKQAFQNCRNLEKVVLPDSVRVISDSAFDDCKSMASLELPPNLEEIGPWAFHSCDRVKSFRIPAGTAGIGEYAFGSCESLEEISVAGENEHYLSIDGNLFDRPARTMIQYAIGKRAEEYAVPDSVEMISFRCFSDAYFLKKVDCRRVRSIGDKAFYYCTSLDTVMLSGDADVGENAFGHTPDSLRKVLLP